MGHITQRVNMINISSDIAQSFIFELEECNDNDEENIDDMSRVKLMSYALYKKYIQTGAALEINIPAKLRNEMTDILDDKHKLLNELNVELNTFLSLFDGIKHEMLKLLMYSYSRFKQKNDYDAIVKLFIKQTDSSDDVPPSIIYQS